MSFFTMPSKRQVGRPPVTGHDVKKDIPMLSCVSPRVTMWPWVKAKS